MRRSLRSVPPAAPAQPVHGQSLRFPVRDLDRGRKLTLVLDTEKDELRVQVSTLRYELENIKQERELEVLRHEKETRDLQSRADADFRKAQVSQVKEKLRYVQANGPNDRQPNLPANAPYTKAIH